MYSFALRKIGESLQLRKGHLIRWPFYYHGTKVIIIWHEIIYGFLLFFCPKDKMKGGQITMLSKAEFYRQTVEQISIQLVV